MKKIYYGGKNRKTMDVNFNKEKIDSSIKKDEKTGLYKIDLPGIKRYFESVYYSYGNINNSFGGKLDKFLGKNIKNSLVGITDIFGYKIICHIELDTLKSSYFFLNNYDIFDIKIGKSSFVVFIFYNFDDSYSFFHNYKGSDFDIFFKNNEIFVKNNLFGSIIFNKKFNLEFKAEKNKYFSEKLKEGYVDVIDFFIFKDFFIENSGYDKFYYFLSNFSNKNIKLDNNTDVKLNITRSENKYYPSIKINLSLFSKNISKVNFFEINKLLLSFMLENTSFYSIDNRYIRNYFSLYINDFTNLDFDLINLDFNLPNNIFKFDKNYNDLKLNILKLRYNLFLLKDSYKNINDKEINGSSIYSEQLKLRISKTNCTLDKTLKNYESQFEKLLLIFSKKFYL